MQEGVVDEGVVADQQVVEAEEHNLVGAGKGVSRGQSTFTILASFCNYYLK